MERKAGKRSCARDWGIAIGKQTPGRFNAITDVPGVRVGHASVVRGRGRLRPGRGPVRTGVTAVWPASRDLFVEKVPAAAHVINGFGKSIGLLQIQEMGTIETPILITNTLNVGSCADALIGYLAFDKGWEFTSINAVVTECNDSYLNDILGRHVRAPDVRAALEHAGNGPVEEGSVGAGTGMSCYSLKGGIGTSSRRVTVGPSGYSLGCLVCANMGKLEELRVDGVPVGSRLSRSSGAAAQGGVSAPPPDSGSVIVLLATDAPLDSRQLGRLARRATNGIARTGTFSESGSGEIAIAWSTSAPERLGDEWLDPLFRAAADSTEEAILNSLWAATSVSGRDGNLRSAVPLAEVHEILRSCNYPFGGHVEIAEPAVAGKGGSS